MDVLNESQPKEKHMNRSQRILASLLFFSITTYLSAQMTVSGTVTDAGTGSALAGANVVVDGTNNGAAADAKLRVSTRAQIKNLSHELAVTTIYVTHDQVEAMTLADRVVVMKQGEIGRASCRERV